MFLQFETPKGKSCTVVAWLRTAAAIRHLIVKHGVSQMFESLSDFSIEIRRKPIAEIREGKEG